MNRFFKIVFIGFLFTLSSVFSQEIKESEQEFIVEVQVVDKNMRAQIKDARVTINGRVFKFSNTKGRYLVEAKKGSELEVSHVGFETVYYTIIDNEDVKVLVEDFNEKKKSKRNPYSRKIVDLYPKYLDSVNFYKKKDIDKSLTAVEKMLLNSSSKSRKATTYKELGDVYFYWKQYDLAVENYSVSLREDNKASVRLLLAKTQFLVNKFDDSEKNYQESLEGGLTNYEKLKGYEGLGDVFMAKKNYTKATTNYTKALKIAKNDYVTPKITDLNSKLAEVFAAQGKTQKANGYFQNSLKLASKENKKRALKEQQKVADFYNESRRYDDEIQLRKQSLVAADDIVIETEEKESLVDSITSQKINYKIGNAYIQKESYNEAIPFLKKSIKDANSKEDLIIEKDATRKLSEVYATVGDYTKALESYQDYVKLVDTLYSKKEQEIQQVKRFGKKIANNQNRIRSLEKDKQLSDSKISLAYKDQQLIQESNKQQKLIIYSLIGGFFLMSLLAYFMFRTNKQQKLANNLLALKSMRSQMNPHFIFNALNSVNNFIAVNDERSANRYLSEFSVLMRSVLENSDEDFIPLAKEIELLELYVKLEHNRFKDKFDYVMFVDEKIKKENFSIPPMLLQPYIENAIWHGLRYKKEKGSLGISMRQQTANTILITVQDDGVGRKRSMEMKTKHQLKQKSKGISTIENRIAILNSMYKDKIDVTVSDVFEDGSGTKVELILKKN
ncbi:histidine kinase [Tenacibaculum sp. AHE15PA]|uniref:tetratricopeptide repeat-containing sensor histidine kinase n=1 Tax=unclassified Tenacibaculum TaxID=2635139 RepID=UPI001C4E6D3B|nr:MULTISPECIES: histidine kinase [unclassified Tenacibaculum]QXP72646.1 histidine kinase [Tenacibaculum sp. AHE14PA]QXP76560.1 histidine kinase [Tenacibaculum sp. AHE15PA]